ncbi:adenine-specific methyltransferase [Acanthocystis turfacea Chlorella virus Canal-1]|nr:adenine-specific methyltransferase [Acanthocystis turfacea Chlorella virus Canal-1]
MVKSSTFQRIGYIGSKYNISEWIFDEISKRTDDTFTSFADLFTGSCIMTHEALSRGYSCTSNDLEKYSHVIASGLRCPYTDVVDEIVKRLDSTEEGESGFVTKTYSPQGGRLFFTEENAMRIDRIRREIENIKDDVGLDTYSFLLASLITSADTVKNTSVVYGAYLKQFKKTALKRMVFAPIHKRQTSVKLETLNEDATKLKIQTDIAYVDPPYNSRQYGANYFVLNQILEPKEAKGVTGISEYNKSSFCRKKEVKEAFESMLTSVRARLFVISYSSESLLTKDEMMGVLSAHGTVEVVEKIHKRFKAQTMEANSDVVEYLFFVYGK